MKTAKWQAAFVAAILGCTCAGWGAVAYVETFGNTAGLEWGARGSVSVQANDGTLEARFAQQSPVPTPETGSLVATNTASGGAFSGNYVGSGLNEIGFRFLAADVKPSAAILRIFGRNRAYVKALDMTEMTAGEWKTFKVSLEGLAEGGWNGGGASEEEFQEDLQDVQWLEVQVTRRGTTAQRYRLDDFSLHTMAESNRPPILQFIPSQVIDEGQELEFSVEATDADGTIPELVAYAMPQGASFTLAGDGTGRFVWTPGKGSHGVWPVRFTASDEEITASQLVRIYVGEPGEEVVDGVPASLAGWEPEFDDLLAQSLSGIATAEWQGREGMLYDVYVSDVAPDAEGWTQLQINVEGSGSEGTNAVEDVELGTERLQRFYRLTFAGETPDSKGVWGVLRREIPSSASLMSVPLRLADRRFAGRMGTALAECLEGSDEGPGTGGAQVYLFDEDGGWVLLYLDAEGVWRDVGGAPTDAELAPGQGFWVVRSGSETVKATFAGRLGTLGEEAVELHEGYNLVGVAEGVAVSLQEALGRVAAEAGTSMETSDCVMLPMADGWRTLMFLEGAGAEGGAAWVDVDTRAVVGADEQLEPGSAFYYLRRGEPTELAF